MQSEETNSQAEDQIPTSNLSRQNFINSSENGLLYTKQQRDKPNQAINTKR